MRVDADNGSFLPLDKLFSILCNLKKLLTIFFVHLLDLPEVSPVLDNIVVELVPRANDSDFGTRKFCERMEPDIVYSSDYQVQNIESRCVQEDNRPRRYFHLAYQVGKPHDYLAKEQMSLDSELRDEFRMSW